jgi:hypothetical protein
VARSGFRWRWTLAFVVGELVGFVPPAVVGAWLGFSGAGDVALVVGLTVAGAVEGLAIGTAQAWVLRRFAPTIPTTGWIVATASGAAVAWLAGMGGAAIMGSGAPPAALVVLVPVWTLGLMAMGYLQWRVMRPVVPKSGRWVPVSSGAWLAGVLIPVAVISTVPDDWPTSAHIALAVLAAVAMGLVVGVWTGGTMSRLLGGPPP